MGSRARVLLTSVFGPYARDDEYGSRALNPMELYQNQVTRAEGPFSLRMFHRSWGIMMIQTNIKAPCTLLDFPTRDRFIAELLTHKYDIVGISSIMPNLEKVRVMCDLVRKYLPHATIVVGGHIANAPGLNTRISADHIVRGEGVRWFRQFLGEPVDTPIRHPQIVSGINTRTMGINVMTGRGEVAATIIPSVGCPMGCNFCATSAMFGGKGKFVNIYETGDELFDIMCELEKNLEVRSFFVMDENFLLHRTRALRLLKLMEEHGKAWSLYVFSSARVLKSYKIEQLIRLGISWVWMGLEGKNSQYVKLARVDTHDLVHTLQSNGIRVLGSTIIGLENHTTENMKEAIAHAVSHATDFHQFMLYTPIPGTPLYAEHKENGTLRNPDDYEEADIHGQLVFRHEHPHIKDGEESSLILNAFETDFRVNGPSILRIARTVLQGWKRHQDNPDPAVRDRYKWESRELEVTFPATLWAGIKWFEKSNPVLSTKLSVLLKEIQKEIGWKARLSAPLVGQYVLMKLRQEDRRLKSGHVYEPPTFYEMNESMARLLRQPKTKPKMIQWVAPSEEKAMSAVG